ncbi:bifunctional 4-hydroxy-2-oxoglutarate aldolase/2-dehydro-3-deoxy-phosphogluconate aldolase [Eubacteriales bacterium mix99]|jgi:2-dehydro-3-deoxyphosphogluconate aldolase/(4S)-4-hydroxy-2-oxoglutarate aldolase|nr:2-dehydro-3-deoxyphosphogluconate aldolase [Clostridiales bacterium]
MVKNATDILQKLGEYRLVSVVRGVKEDKALHTMEALYRGGIRAVEITMNTSGALRMLENIKKAYGDKMLVGAGTVLDPENAVHAIQAGADFVLSPTLSVRVIEACNRYSRLAVPGVLTPTEILTAWEAGAQLVKIFPARVFGPKYIQDIKKPLLQVEIMPVGGVSLKNAADFMKNGAYALGIGSALVNPEWTEQGEFEKITQAAATFVKIVNGVTVI